MEGCVLHCFSARVVFGLLTSREREEKEHNTSGHAVIGKIIYFRVLTVTLLGVILYYITLTILSFLHTYTCVPTLRAYYIVANLLLTYVF